MLSFTARRRMLTFEWFQHVVEEAMMSESQEVAGPTHLSSPKLTPIPLAEMSERTREQLSWAKLNQEGEPPALFGTLARRPKLLASWLPFAGRLLPGGTLDRRSTELVILRVASNMGSDYEWGQRVQTVS